MKSSKKPIDLFKFAFFPNYNGAIKYLAENLADKEEWDFSDTTSIKNTILKNYLEYTFKRLLLENKIVFTKDNKHASFNTGLITNNLEEIFAFFEEYRNPKLATDSHFCFKAFLKKSNNEFLKYFSSNVPDIADYFEKPEDLIFNPRLELIPDVEHIIKDNIDRFPAHLRHVDGAELRRQLFGAIEEVKKKVRTNKKLQFHNITMAEYNFYYHYALLPDLQIQI